MAAPHTTQVEGNGITYKWQGDGEVASFRFQSDRKDKWKVVLPRPEGEWNAALRSEGGRKVVPRHPKGDRKDAPLLYTKLVDCFMV